MIKVLLAVLLLSSPIFAESYTGESESDKGVIKVSVDIDKDKIKAIKVLESKGYPKFIFNKLIRNIIKENGVDAESGATPVTKGFQTAVINALKSADFPNKN